MEIVWQDGHLSIMRDGFNYQLIDHGRVIRTFTPGELRRVQEALQKAKLPPRLHIGPKEVK